MTHAQLVDAAFHWLKTHERCPVVVAELVTSAGETADVIGWTSGGASILIECKASRADFMADRRKHFRREPEVGMGSRRYYCAPLGVLRADEMPPGWGLLNPTPTRMVVAKPSECPCSDEECWHHGAFEKRAHTKEAVVLMSLIRRLAGPGVRGKARVFIRAYTLDEKGNTVAPALESPGADPGNLLV